MRSDRQRSKKFIEQINELKDPTYEPRLRQLGPRIHMRNSPRFAVNYDPRQILIGDVDGDGVADLIFVDHCKMVLWINQSGNGWSDPIEIDGTPGFTNQDDVRLVDLLGTGVAGILWSLSALGNRRERFFFHDFTGGC